MGYCRAIELPSAEPVSLADARSFLRLSSAYTAEDDTIEALIVAAREQGEVLTGRALAKRKFTQVLDSHPYYTDSVQSQLAYPPNYYSLPRYSTTLWNYSQMIKLGYSPVISVEGMIYIAPDGSSQTWLQDTQFILDRISEPARIFPLPGQNWPADLNVANSLQINFTAGYDPDPTAVDTHVIGSPPLSPPGQQVTSTIVSGIPQKLRLAILNLVAFWFQNRGAAGTVPPYIENIFLSHAIYDFAPTRG